MKKNIILLIIISSLCFWACEEQHASRPSLKDIEKQENEILNCINKIEKYRVSLEQILEDLDETENSPQLWFKLAKLNEVFGHYDKAVEYYKNLVTLFPDEPSSGDGLYNLAQIYDLHLDQNHNAKIAYQQFITLFPMNKSVAAAHIKLGQIYCWQNEWEKAIDIFEMIINKFPEHRICDDVQFRIADILEHRIKDISGASAAYQQVVENYPDSPWTVPSRNRIEHLTDGGDSDEN